MVQTLLEHKASINSQLGTGPHVEAPSSVVLMFVEWLVDWFDDCAVDDTYAIIPRTSNRLQFQTEGKYQTEGHSGRKID